MIWIITLIFIDSDITVTYLNVLGRGFLEALKFFRLSFLKLFVEPIQTSRATERDCSKIGEWWD